LKNDVKTICWLVVNHLKPQLSIERVTVEGRLTETERVNWLSTLDKRVPAETRDFQPNFTALTDIVEQLKKTKQKLRSERQ
jgi:hypothetical protein